MKVRLLFRFSVALTVILLITGYGPNQVLPSVADSATVPWGLSAISTSGLNGETFESALPYDFSSYVLNTGEIPGFTYPVLERWAQSTKNFAYYDPASPGSVPGVIATETNLAAGWTMPDAIAALSKGDANRSAAYKVEQSARSKSDAVPFVLASKTDRTGVARYSIAWGMREGRWLFEIQASTSADREVFVKTLVRQILTTRHDGSILGTPSMPLGKVPPAKTAATPNATASPTNTAMPTPSPTNTPRPTMTPTSTPIPSPSPTSTPQPTATPDEQADIQQTEQTAISCMEKEDFYCPATVFTAALRRHPNNVRLRDDLYTALMVLGLAQEEAEDIDGARATYQRTFDLDSARIEASRALDILRPYSRILLGEGLRGEENSTFKSGTNDFGDSYFANNSLQLRAKNGQGIQFTFSQTVGLTRSSISIRCRWIEGDGVIDLSYSDPENAADIYELEFKPTTSQWRFATHNYVNDTWEILIPWTYVSSVPPDGVWKLELRLVDGVFYMLINQRSVGSISSSTFQAGEAHFGVGLFSDGYSPTFTAAFNDLRLFEIN